MHPIFQSALNAHLPPALRMTEAQRQQADLAYAGRRAAGELERAMRLQLQQPQGWGGSV